GIETRIKEATELWQDDVRELGNRIKRLNTAIEKAQTAAGHTGDDTEVTGLMGQRRAISNLIREKRDDYTLSTLGRLGLLPNYTLVEDSVRLSASLWSDDDDGDFQVEKWDYERAGTMAVREFAPGNSFYAGGHRHIIDTLEIGGVDEPDYAPWRLCPDCGFGAPEEPDTPVARCPRCGEAGIMGVGARHNMLRLRQVYASGPEEGARVFDESDNRRQERFEVITTIDVDPAHVQGAWRLSADEAPAFGAELAPNTVLRTINFGYAEKKGPQVAVAGSERHVTRFETCAHCGTSQDVNEGKGKPRPEGRHQGWCKVRSGAISKKDAFRELVLFHELTTDAVRMMLPVSMFEVNERLASFKAALLLGLRKDFGGDPDHLRVAMSDMPNQHGQGRRNFLVLYDRVPGGTGYLQRLADPDRVREILVKGRDLIARCVCQADGRRACHRCLLGVVDRNEYDLVSRDLALWLLDSLLADWQTEAIATVAGIDLGRTEESELERRFKVALHDWCDRSDHEHLRLSGRAGKKGYDAFELRIDHPDGTTLRWHIDEQEGLSNHNTIPDFTITRADKESRPVAIYLDGYQFHASAENPNMAADAAMRNGVRGDGLIVWNLSWGDVEAFHNAAVSETNANVKPRPLLSGVTLNAARGQHANLVDPIDYVTVNRNPVELLLSYLSEPDDERWHEIAVSTIVGTLADGANRGNMPAEQVQSVLQAMAAGASFEWEDSAGFAIGAVTGTTFELPIGVLLRLDDPKALRLTAVASLPDDAASIDDENHRSRWQDWLQWSNVLQFLNGPGREALVTTTGSDHSIIGEMFAVTAADTDQPASSSLSEVGEDPITVSDEMVEELELILDNEVARNVRLLLEAGAPDFVAGAEHDGLALEAGWPEHKVAIVPNGWNEAEPSGWRIERPDSLNLDEVLELIGVQN
ncbi:DUF1998 domain-containing protein, partial [Acidimicrobiales bacterium]|nr:DUF1998 domain-containing protein [Acidimicrobiales bacterium]